MSQVEVSDERLELVKSEEVRLDIPDTEDKRWLSAEIFGIAGCFHTELLDMFIDFGGYLKVLPDGYCRGMMTDNFGDAIILGMISADRMSVKLSKIYCVYLSNCTATQPLTYELESEDKISFKGKWYYESEYLDEGAEVVCSLYPTGITAKAFSDEIREVRDREALAVHHDEYLALTGEEEELD